jgi:hypothetical protein
VSRATQAALDADRIAQNARLLKARVPLNITWHNINQFVAEEGSETFENNK